MRTRLLAGASCLLLAACASAADRPAHGAGWSASAPYSAATLNWLWRVADRAAHANGGQVAHAEAVRSTRRVAVALTSDARVQGDQAVWVVQVRGRGVFVCGGCSYPANGSAPRGRYLTLIISVSTHRGSDGGIGPTAADLAKLGKVVELHP